MLDVWHLMANSEIQMMANTPRIDDVRLISKVTFVCPSIHLSTSVYAGVCERLAGYQHGSADH